MYFEDDLFSVKIYPFYFLHGTDNHNKLQLHGKLKQGGKCNPCMLKVSALAKTLYVKTKDNQSLSSMSDEQFKKTVENCLKGTIRGMVTFSSEIVQKQTIHQRETSRFLKIQYQKSNDFNYDNDYVPENSCIEHIYGLNEYALDAFLREKAIKGPCWLEVETYSISKTAMQISEVECHPFQVTVASGSLMNDKPPRLNLAFLDIVSIPTVSEKLEPIAIAVVCAGWDEGNYDIHFKKIFMVSEKKSREDIDDKMQLTKICNTSGEVVQYVNSFLAEKHTDILICYDKEQFLGNLNMYQPTFKTIFGKYVVIDLKMSAHEFYPHLLLKVEHLFKHFLNDASDVGNVQPSATNFPEDLLARVCKFLQVASEMDVVGTYIYLAKLTGCQLKSVAGSGQLKRIEHLLKHELSSLPTVVLPEQSMRPKKEAISGGRVMDAKVGFYNSLVVAFDFRSLYPSVIREFGLSFDASAAFLPDLMGRLLEMREEQQTTTSESSKRPSRSKLLKLLANSIYGCLSSEYSAFYHPRLAKAITKCGRDLLTATAHELETKLVSMVIFGHTDSLFANVTGSTNYAEVCERVEAFLEALHVRYRHLRLKLVGMFSHAFIFSKQQYALRYHDDYQRGNEDLAWVVKGVLGRTVPLISQRVFRYLLELVSAKGPRCARTDALITMMRGAFASDDVDEYAVHVQLQNAPATYAGHTAYGHVVQRRNLHSACAYRCLDYVSHVVCDDRTRNAPPRRAYDLEEVVQLQLRVDKAYCKQRLLRLLQKVFDVSEGRIDADKVRRFLLADGNATCTPTRIRHHALLVHFHFRCLHCAQLIVLDAPSLTYEHFLQCDACSTRFAVPEQVAEVRAAVQRTIDEYERQLVHARRMAALRGPLRELAAAKVASLELQFRQQMTYWQEIIGVVRFTLEWCSHRDLLLVDETKAMLNQLFGTLLQMMSESMTCLLQEPLEVIDFRDINNDS